MSKVNEFKEFVKKNPKLVTHVKDGKMNWQKFYELYDLYGEDNEIWKDYLGVAVTTASIAGIADAFKWLKSINLDNVQTGVNNLQRVLGVFQDLSKKEPEKEEYKPRPIYKHFDD